jgi:autotransporter-associated beta strand protein
VNTGGTLDLFGNSLSVGALSGAGTITSTAGNTPTLTTNSAVDTTFSGIIQNGLAVSVGLTKQGNGTLTLSGFSTYTGETHIGAGTLIVDGSISGGATGGTVFIEGGTLKGLGATGPIALTAGTLSPGNAIGILSTGELSLSSGTVAFELGGNTPGTGSGFHDQVNVTNTVAFNAPITLALDFASYDPVEGVDSFVIVNNDDVDPVLFGHANARFFHGATRLEEGTIFPAVSGPTTQFFSISYAGGTGNDVVLTAVVPEPASLLLCGLGAMVGLGVRRRSRPS